MTVTIHQGDALEVLRTLPAESVHCCVCSPPYWGLRDYGVPGQLGLEPTPEEHVARMVEVFREVRRVLRADGTAWVNYGDCYVSNGRYESDRSEYVGDLGKYDHRDPRPGARACGLKPKDLVGMPWRIAFALQADGWWLRSDIVWAKRNCMPESVTDRPTRAHEYVFLLSKSARYFYDATAVREPFAESTLAEAPLRGRDDSERFAGGAQGTKKTYGLRHAMPNPAGRNLRSVWWIATHAFPLAHFATFPPALVEPCVKAGTSEKGCCATCGAPWERVVEKELHATRGKVGEHCGEGRADPLDAGSSWNHSGGVYGRYSVETKAWRPTCDHGGAPIPCTVLDPFAGACTTLLVADRLGRNGIGIELNPSYAEMGRKRLVNDCPMFTSVSVVKNEVADPQTPSGAQADAPLSS